MQLIRPASICVEYSDTAWYLEGSVIKFFSNCEPLSELYQVTCSRENAALPTPWIRAGRECGRAGIAH
jgi:hypothetical protein